MLLYSLCHKGQILNYNPDLVSHLKPTLLADVLDAVDKLAGNTLVKQLRGDGDVQRHGQLTLVGNKPSGYILGDDLHLFSSDAVRCATN